MKWTSSCLNRWTLLLPPRGSYFTSSVKLLQKLLYKAKVGGSLQKGFRYFLWNCTFPKRALGVPCEAKHRPAKVDLRPAGGRRRVYFHPHWGWGCWVTWVRWRCQSHAFGNMTVDLTREPGACESSSTGEFASLAPPCLGPPWLRGVRLASSSCVPPVDITWL
jgi:hypothetical protein